MAYECDDEIGSSGETGSEKDGSGSDDDDDSDDGDDYVKKEEFHDSDYEFEEDDRNFDSHVDHNVGMFNDMVMVDHQGIPNEVLAGMHNEEGDDNCVDSDDLDSNLDSDDGERKSQKFPVFDPIKNAKNPDLKVGMIFSSRDEAKFSTESHCIRRGKSVRFVKVDKKRLRGRCRNEGCDWVIHVSPMGRDSCRQIKTFKSEHNGCFWDNANRTASLSWLGKTFVKKFKSNWLVLEVTTLFVKEFDRYGLWIEIFPRIVLDYQSNEIFPDYLVNFLSDSPGLSCYRPGLLLFFFSMVQDDCDKCFCNQSHMHDDE